MVDQDEWNWRNRLRDPRLAGILLLTLLTDASFALFEHGPIYVHLAIGGFTLLPVAIICASVLPPWRDPKHGPAAGGLALGGCGLVVFLTALAVELAQ